MRQKLFIFLSLAAVLLLPLSSLQAAVVIAQAKGKVDIKRAGYSNWIKVSPPVAIYKGDEVRTGWFSRADLAFGDGVAFKIAITVQMFGNNV